MRTLSLAIASLFLLLLLPTARADEAADRKNDNATTQPAQGQLSDNQINKIRVTLREVTELALNRDSFNQLSRYYSQPARDQLADSIKDMKFDDLNSQIEQFRSDWKDKYKESFNISDGKSLYEHASYRFAPGGIAANAPQPAGAPMTPEDKNVNRDQNKTDSDKTRATVTALADHDLAQVSIPFIEQTAGDWRIDLSQVDGARLKTALSNHLTTLSSQKANWPADVNDGYRAVTHHILLAIAEASQGTGQPQLIVPPAQPAGGTLQPDLKTDQNMNHDSDSDNDQDKNTESD